MRADSLGLFWQDIAPVKPPKKEKVKRTPPNPFWKEAGYIPLTVLEEAQSYIFDEMNDMELIHAQREGHRLIYDSESYPNYGLHGFKNIVTGKHLFFESSNYGHDFDRRKFSWVMQNFTLITFNGIKYDAVIANIAASSLYDHSDMWAATDLLIGQQTPAHEVLKHYGITKDNRLKINQIDIIELTALSPGLKKCAARLHARKLQDLPFTPGTDLTQLQCLALKRYNVNDLDNTQLVYESKLEVIELREAFGKKYNLDLRSKSDAQMAEAIIKAEIKRITGRKFIKPTEIHPGTTFRYKVPKYIQFHTPLLNSVLKAVREAAFVVNSWDGGIIMPPELANMELDIAGMTYKMGIGGLHSQESNTAHYTDDRYLVIDTDVTSYYPSLILNAGLTPQNLGMDFLNLYRSIFKERIAAKDRGDNIVAQCLKIVLNGTYGKLGSMWSIMYAPDLMLQVTITGQLCLLMLIERFALANIEVTSANTDGVVVKCAREMEEHFHSIVQQWETQTGLRTEEIRYKATFNKDVNNYFAIYDAPQKGETFKTKGLYAKTSAAKNAVNEICVHAVKEYMANSTPIVETVRNCKEMSMFTTMREAARGGGAVYGEQFLGKVVRWYYSTESQGEIVMAKSGNKIARSDGAKPCMDLPSTIPQDLDYDWYVTEAYSVLEKIGHKTVEPELVE